MRPAQFTIREFILLFRRRKRLLIIPTVVVTLICGIGARLLPGKYESSTTILVQREEILNPLISYEMAVTMASEDRLRTFNEIIYSRATIQKMIDSLGMGANATTEEQRQALVDGVSHNITTERRGSDSFRITYIDTDPVRAQRAASLLSKLFINTILNVEGQRDERAVEFFEKKLEDLRAKFEASQKQVVARLGQRLGSMPTESKTAYGQVEALDKQVRDSDTKIKDYQDELAVLRTSTQNLHTEDGKKKLYDLTRSEVPFAADLKVLMLKYEDFLRRYTPRYPEVEKTEKQLIVLIERMKSGVESEIEREQTQRVDLERRRAQLLSDIRQTTISERVDEDQESDYGIYRKLYDEMKVKLEQARTTRDLGEKGASQFIIIDPAQVPTHPSKPNRMQLTLGGLGLGIFLGFLAVILKEMLDTTIRIPRDIEVYQKPVIAFITDGNEHQLK